VNDTDAERLLGGLLDESFSSAVVPATWRTVDLLEPIIGWREARGLLARLLETLAAYLHAEESKGRPLSDAEIQDLGLALWAVHHDGPKQ